MHFLTLVLIPTDGDPEEHVRRLLEPHVEFYNEAKDEMSGWWDWYTIGGRWTGFLDGYNPEKDPRNHEVCVYCRGTPGMRYDLQPAGAKCNSCGYNSADGPPVGTRVKWPTQWVKHFGDVQTCPFELRETPYRIVYADGSTLARETYEPGAADPFPPVQGFDETVRSALRNHTGRVVVVDYHS